MINFVESIEIDGFWGNKKVQIKFYRDLNFLIGANGSGKTTIINLLAAVLRADIPTLYATQFEKVRVKLRSFGRNQKPVIEVAKIVNPSLGNIELIYSVKEKTTEEGQTFGIEGPSDERLYRDSRYVRSRRSQEMGARLGSILGQIVSVNWVTVHRGTFERFSRAAREEEFDTVIDQRIWEMSRKFASYFSLLDSKATEVTKGFQEYVFLSLLEQDDDRANVFAYAEVEPEDRRTVIGVLRTLGVSQAQATRSVSSHYSKLEAAVKSARDRRAISMSEAITLSDSRRIKHMVDKWRDSVEARSKIFRPKTVFEEIINKLFTGKEIRFDARNDPVIHLASGEKVGVSVLSSGEKQLFILLGEALLQEEKPVVFISDEPELSLHVSWQNTLFEDIRKLNGSCQVITATHSPDIVGKFQDRIIEVRECIHDIQ
ncbi:AAA family ATPase [Rubellimicrobium aerolatum]|uniref:AAA family ATPase n=1 Tax=Rubellimicrobium aerolatum TaxID=490979 RepID=A0ABW0S9S4_9RHOB|nr:AAA family ATPase [Rubellimicrobium aerolatum]MBP1805030.1 energy-coupling factor transporter ATP-binding protein EcfA2 [Rubellimicrobium aerolatum]